MSRPTHTEPRRGGRPLALALTCAALAGLVVAGCGSSGNNSTTSSGGSSTGASTAGGGASTTASNGVTPAQLQATVDQAMQAHIPISSVPPLMQDALSLATPTPSAADMDKAFTCFQQTTCTLGSGKITLGYADGFGDNTWRRFSKMSAILQAMRYPDIGKIIFTNAHGQLATFQSDIRNLTAQGARAIVTYDDFGPSAYPAYTAAQRSGAVVSSFVSPLDGAPTSAVTTRVQPDICTAGRTMASVTRQAVGSAGVAYFTGTPGNPQDTAWQRCATTAGTNAIFKADTNWTPAGAQTAASALIASGKPARAILYSYSNPVPNIVKAFNSANKPVPAIITWTQDNGTSCIWRRSPFTLYQTNALNWAARVSVTATMTRLDGKSVPDAVIYPFPFVRAKASDCDPSRPADYPGTSALVPTALVTKILGG
jgi:ABC-type sugar transport system substrate-binding protein